MSWCPIGYMNISEIAEKCEIAASKIVRGASEAFPPLKEDIVSKLFAARSALTESIEEESEGLTWGDAVIVVQDLLLEAFLNQHAYSAVAVSPTGQIFKLNRMLTRPVRYNYWRSFGRLFRRPAGLLFIDLWPGVIELDRVEERMIYAFEGENHLGDCWQEHAMKFYSHLDRWSVCFPEKIFETISYDLGDLWVGKATEQPSRVGRPRIREDVAAAYRKWFPEGHGNMSVKQVLRTLRERTGVDTSADTLRRALSGE